ncbi:MAG: hypothetical protein H6899_00495 [Rhodobacter sp.]|nr:hypothetical protein [Paracoccaceae bacterium]MCB1409884.1 hypothetical protein [Paracoccaceae bacterium]MCC0078448.1 hypothetical protein [Rhodobacter sp.]
MWDAQAIDELTEVVVTRLLVQEETARAVAADLARGLAASSPALPALSLALPFALAAGSIEEMLGAGLQARRAARDAWRISALIGVDALSLRQQGADTIADLWALWQAGDEVFRAAE